MDQVLAYLPNVIAAVIMFVVAAALAGAVGGLIHKLMGDTGTGRLLQAAAPALVMVIAVFMILNQLKIAQDIVTITYAAILGALALGMALAFGLGGRQVAGRTCSARPTTVAATSKDEVRRDLEIGKQRAQDRAEGVGDGTVPADATRGTQPPPLGSDPATGVRHDLTPDARKEGEGDDADDTRVRVERPNGRRQRRREDRHARRGLPRHGRPASPSGRR